MKKVKIAIIGCGRIAERHAEQINKFGILVAVCDIDSNKVQKFVNKYNCKGFNNIDDLLNNKIENLDVISICTPNGLHAQHSIKSLKSGYNVLCEKPMAIKIEDCGEMIKIAEKMNKRLFIIKQNRFNPPVEKLKNIIDNNLLGKIFNVQLNCFWNRNEDYYFNSWKGTTELDGGTLFTQFSHFIDLLYWLIGDVDIVKSFTNNYLHNNIIEFEDTGVVILKFLNGAIGTINYTVNSFGKNMEGSITVFGEYGTIKIGGQYLNELEYQNIKDHIIENLPIGNTANNYGTYQGSMSNHDMVYKNVIDVLTKNASINANMFEGLKTVEIINKIYKAANEY
jgi:UDP-N-acetyl-2-amino-2-deoxyglucuronate dehydrogenase